MYLIVTLVHKLCSPAHLGTSQKCKFLGPTPYLPNPNARARGGPAICIFPSSASELEVAQVWETTGPWKFCTGTIFWHREDTVFKSPGTLFLGLECGPRCCISHKLPGDIDTVGVWSQFWVTGSQDASNKTRTHMANMQGEEYLLMFLQSKSRTKCLPLATWPAFLRLSTDLYEETGGSGTWPPTIGWVQRQTHGKGRSETRDSWAQEFCLHL